MENIKQYLEDNKIKITDKWANMSMRDGKLHHTTKYITFKHKKITYCVSEATYVDKSKHYAFSSDVNYNPLSFVNDEMVILKIKSILEEVK